MQGRQNDVPCERGLRGEPRCLCVPDFADQNHIRVLPQHCPQGFGKGQFEVRGGLNDALDPKLDGILNGHRLDAG